MQECWALPHTAKLTSYIQIRFLFKCYGIAEKAFINRGIQSWVSAVSMYTFVTTIQMV